MDLGAFVQENKRWLACVGIGAVAFFAAFSIIGSTWDPQPIYGKARSAAADVNNKADTFGREALAAARQEQEALAAAQTRYESELRFRQDPAFVLDGKPQPDAYLAKVARDLKIRILREANERQVVVTDKDLNWSTWEGHEEMRSVLFTLEIASTAAQRLFAAHDAVRQADPRALGLVQFKLTVERQRRAPGRPSRTGGADFRDRLQQESLAFEFHADEATTVLFLESLRQPDRTLSLKPGLSIQQPGGRGQPLRVTGALVATAFRAKETN